MREWPAKLLQLRVPLSFLVKLCGWNAEQGFEFPFKPTLWPFWDSKAEKEQPTFFVWHLRFHLMCSAFVLRPRSVLLAQKRLGGACSLERAQLPALLVSWWPPKTVFWCSHSVRLWFLKVRLWWREIYRGFRTALRMVLCDDVDATTTTSQANVPGLDLGSLTVLVLAKPPKQVRNYLPLATSKTCNWQVGVGDTGRREGEPPPSRSCSCHDQAVVVVPHYFSWQINRMWRETQGWLRASLDCAGKFPCKDWSRLWVNTDQMHVSVWRVSRPSMSEVRTWTLGSEKTRNRWTILEKYYTVSRHQWEIGVWRRWFFQLFQNNCPIPQLWSAKLEKVTTLHQGGVLVACEVVVVTPSLLFVNSSRIQVLFNHSLSVTRHCISVKASFPLKLFSVQKQNSAVRTNYPCIQNPVQAAWRGENRIYELHVRPSFSRRRRLRRKIEMSPLATGWRSPCLILIWIASKIKPRNILYPVCLFCSDFLFLSFFLSFLMNNWIKTEVL